MTAKEDDKYCSFHLTQQECKDNGCLWLEDGYQSNLGNSIGKQICVNEGEYKIKLAGRSNSVDDWNEYVKDVELQKKTAIRVKELEDNLKEISDKVQKEATIRVKELKDNLKETSNKVQKEATIRVKELKDNLKETSNKVQKEATIFLKENKTKAQTAKQKAQDKLEGMNNGKIQTFLSNIKKFIGIGGSINHSPSLYNATKQHYLNLKSRY
jgi:hypothetical protein